MPYGLLKWEQELSAVQQVQVGAGPALRIAFGSGAFVAPGVDLHASWHLVQRLFVSADYDFQPWEPNWPSRYDFTLGLGVRLW